jgi:dipeptidyl aminopeptidase/acylaminoacyl peptidase
MNALLLLLRRLRSNVALPFTFGAAVLLGIGFAPGAAGQVTPPESLVLDGLPPIPAALKSEASRYLEFRTASFNNWHPLGRELLITTRFADTLQIHLVQMPGGARRQLTFSAEPVAGGSFQPRTGRLIVFSQDSGGGEFYQLYRYDPQDGRVTLLTDGKSRNTGVRWARSGKLLAYTSTRRNGKDNDIYLIDPASPQSDRRVLEVTGGGWSVEDWSHDETQLLLAESLSINQTHLYLFDLKTNTRRKLTPDNQETVAYANARFASDDRSVFVTSDLDAEHRRLVEIRIPAGDAQTGKPSRVLSEHIPWDIDEFDLSSNGERIAFITNEGGFGVLHLLEVKSGREKPVSGLPAGVLSGVRWRENGRELALSVSSARSPTDVFSVDIVTGKVERWTESETGGLDAAHFVEPELIKLPSFDGVPISAFVYRPDPKKFPGPRPVLVSIHGGPEAQARPGFQARNNFFINELGITLVLPNVRGSSGYGKTFLTLDNGIKREDSVRDIGAILDWLARDPGLNRNRFAVMGGSYGGYMVLACMEHFNDRLRCGVDIVGISNFLTFLKNTQDYRRDLRRVEYGDERDETMRGFLERISPTTNVRQIRKPLFVVQGQNDPRVPVTEAAQMVKALRDNSGIAWYLVGKDEGHGFAKKRNVDFQFLATVEFLREFLLAAAN